MDGSTWLSTGARHVTGWGVKGCEGSPGSSLFSLSANSPPVTHLIFAAKDSIYSHQTLLRINAFLITHTRWMHLASVTKAWMFCTTLHLFHWASFMMTISQSGIHFIDLSLCFMDFYRLTQGQQRSIFSALILVHSQLTLRKNPFHLFSSSELRLSYNYPKLWLSPLPLLLLFSFFTTLRARCAFYSIY